MAILERDIFRMRFTAPLHLARGNAEYAQSQELLHSDTLKSAIYTAARQLWKELAEDPGRSAFFDGFRLSSALPFWRDELFFPKPYLQTRLGRKADGKDVHLISIEGLEEAREAKVNKKIDYYSQTYFEHMISGRTEPLKVDKSHLIGGGRFLARQPGKKDEVGLMKTELQQRVTIWIGEDANPYLVERMHFGPEAGLFFIVEYTGPQAETVRRQVEAGMRLLGDTGLGTDRHVGNGLFEAEPGRIRLEVPDTPQGQLSLSLFCPKDQEELEHLGLKTDSRSAFQLINRTGWITATQPLDLRKRSIFMFAEGSVFATPQRPEGKCVDLAPTADSADTPTDKPTDKPKLAHPVLREGRGLFIPVRFVESAEQTA